MLNAFVFGMFGLIVGSFLNVVILRHGTRGLSGRSGCFSCGKQLLAFDMIPVVSWLVLGGQCRQCGSRISVQYPLIETVTAVLFALIGSATFALAWPQIALTVLYLAIASLLVCIAAYDIRHTIIPDAWAYSFAGLALLSAFLAPLSSASLVYALLAGPLATVPLFTLWLISRGRWMGLGDVKLALGIGWLLGPIAGIFSVLFAFIIGAFISLAILLPWPFLMRQLRKAGIVRGVAHASYTMKSEVPFGPFLIASCIYVWFSLLYALPIIGMP